MCRMAPRRHGPPDGPARSLVALLVELRLRRERQRLELVGQLPDDALILGGDAGVDAQVVEVGLVVPELCPELDLEAIALDGFQGEFCTHIEECPLLDWRRLEGAAEHLQQAAAAAVALLHPLDRLAASEVDVPALVGRFRRQHLPAGVELLPRSGVQREVRLGKALSCEGGLVNDLLASGVDGLGEELPASLVQSPTSPGNAVAAGGAREPEDAAGLVIQVDVVRLRRRQPHRRQLLGKPGRRHLVALVKLRHRGGLRNSENVQAPRERFLSLRPQVLLELVVDAEQA
mmetsp:Transcript_91283/g.178751  ORF Transcript_91283/g.178751 Transcript_91283/m.178751 type:complete len:289 (-) Transcript_91283:684-1550(-)